MNNFCKPIESFGSIPDLNYEGYIWMSDEPSPRLITDKKEIPQSLNPFVIEGNLYCPEKKVSVSIRHMGNKSLILLFNLEEASQAAVEKKIELTDHQYLTHRAPNKQFVLFKQAWIPQKDPLCEGFDVLKPAWKAFVGFKNKQED